MPEQLQKHRDYMASQFASFTLEDMERDWMKRLMVERLYAAEAKMVELAIADTAQDKVEEIEEARITGN